MTKRKPRLPEVARVDERTVQAVARGEKMPPRGRRWPRRGPPGSGPVSSLRVNPDVWRTARELAGDDPRCIQIVSEEEVIVWNHGPPWPRPGGEADRGE